jgi:hypothetical protein
LCFTARPGPATLLSLTTVKGGRLRFIITEGEVPDMAPIPAVNRVHFKFRPNQPLPEFLKRFSEAGGVTSSGSRIRACRRQVDQVGQTDGRGV